MLICPGRKLRALRAYAAARPTTFRSTWDTWVSLARWPIRRFTIRANTLFAQCSATCSVAGVVEWDANSVERNEHSVGSANFVVRIAPPGLIISENGSVLFGHKEPLQAVSQARASIPIPETAAAANPDIVAALSTPAYADGRRDRIAYEQWVASLADGSYRGWCDILGGQPQRQTHAVVRSWSKPCLSGCYPHPQDVDFRGLGNIRLIPNIFAGRMGANRIGRCLWTLLWPFRSLCPIPAAFPRRGLRRLSGEGALGRTASSARIAALSASRSASRTAPASCAAAPAARDRA